MADKERLAKTTSESAHRDDGLNRGEDVTTGGLVRALASFARESLTLLALEGRLALVSLIGMLAAGIFAGVLLVSSWLFLLGAVAVALVRFGWAWEVVLMAFVAANTVAALVCWLTIRRLSKNLLFTATLRNFRPKKVESPDHA
jgi:hypothetical protein